MDEQVIKDIKHLLIEIWETLESEFSQNPWTRNSESCKKYREIASKYGITNKNLLEDLDEDTEKLYCNFIKELKMMYPYWNK